MANDSRSLFADQQNKHIILQDIFTVIWRFLLQARADGASVSYIRTVNVKLHLTRKSRVKEEKVLPVGRPR